jgi:phosphatidylglycerophosphate synthase
MSFFAVAAITDWLDGYLARRWGATSEFGAFLDPVADKLMVAAALITARRAQSRRSLSRHHHHWARNRHFGAP